MMGSGVTMGSIPRLNVPVTPKPIKPSLRVRNVFNELSHEQPDGQRVVRIANLPMALEALGADLNSWEGRTALTLANGWAKLGGDAAIDIFEFTQATEELRHIKPPISSNGSGGKAEKGTSQGSRSWMYGSPLSDGAKAKKSLHKAVEEEVRQRAAMSSDPSDSDSDDDGTSSLMSARLNPGKKCVGRPAATKEDPPPPPTPASKALLTMKSTTSPPKSRSKSPPASGSSIKSPQSKSPMQQEQQGWLSGAVNAIENVTGIDIDGDGKVGRGEQTPEGEKEKVMIGSCSSSDMAVVVVSDREAAERGPAPANKAMSSAAVSSCLPMRAAGSSPLRAAGTSPLRSAVVEPPAAAVSPNLAQRQQQNLSAVQAAVMGWEAMENKPASSREVSPQRGGSRSPPRSPPGYQA